MPRFIAIPAENERTHYLNLDLIRAVHDHPDEDGIRVDFDEQHRLYLDRERARPLLEAVRDAK